MFIKAIVVIRLLEKGSTAGEFVCNLYPRGGSITNINYSWGGWGYNTQKRFQIDVESSLLIGQYCLIDVNLKSNNSSRIFQPGKISEIIKLVETLEKLKIVHAQPSMQRLV